MTTPRDFELAVAADFERRGYTTQVSGGVHDWGVDVFATRGSERLAVQAKMYGGARAVNRRQIFELVGVAAYFDCTGAVLATDGDLASDAAAVAEKLGVTILRIGLADSRPQPDHVGPELDFPTVWKRSIMPLVGRTLTRPDGSSNDIVSVDWAGVTRRSSSGRRQFIPIEIFRWAIERVLVDGSVTRDAINERYEGRASSGIVLILGQVPEFHVGGRPTTVRLRSGRT